MGRAEDAGWVSWNVAGPVIDRLVEFVGTKYQAAEMIGMHSNALSMPRQFLRRTAFNQALYLVGKYQDARAAGRNRHAYFKVGGPMVVHTDVLGKVIRDWTLRYLKERPRAISKYTAQGDGFVGPMDWLSTEVGIHPRKISGITSGELVTVNDILAEKLLIAMGEEWRLSTRGPDRIQVIPNPNWRIEWWIDYMREQGCV